MKKYSEQMALMAGMFFPDIHLGDVPDIESKDVVVEAKENPLLDVIYGRDERTNLPKGDISLFLSGKTNPQIREFISQNLHSKVPDTPSIPADCNEDITPYIRNQGESRNQYIKRVSNLVRSEEHHRRELAREKQLLENG